MRTLHPQAIALTLLINSARSMGERDLEEGAHAAIASMFDEYDDDRKADIYARIAESVKANMTMTQMQETVSRCLWDNENMVAHG